MQVGLMHQHAIVGRIAPTPSGFIHLGNEFNFILTWLMIRSLDAKLLLRIDDLDRTRFRPHYLEDIFVRLRELGLDWDMGPQDAKDFDAHYSQTLRIKHYHELLQQLVNLGLVYACTCSRKDNGCKCAGGLQKGSLNPNPNLPWRLLTINCSYVDPNLPQNGVINYQHQLLKTEHNFVVRRRDGLPAYQIASLADDLFFGVNLIVRGADLWGSTLNQLYLANLLNEKPFLHCQFVHHPLLLTGTEKLSKSVGNAGQRKAPSEVFQLFCQWMQWPIMQSAQECLQWAKETRSLEKELHF